MRLLLDGLKGGALNSNDKWHILMTVEDEGDLFFVNATEMA